MNFRYANKTYNSSPPALYLRFKFYLYRTSRPLACDRVDLAPFAPLGELIQPQVLIAEHGRLISSLAGAPRPVTVTVGVGIFPGVVIVIVVV